MGSGSTLGFAVAASVVPTAGPNSDVVLAAGATVVEVVEEGGAGSVLPMLGAGF